MSDDEWDVVGEEEDPEAQAMASMQEAIVYAVETAEAAAKTCEKSEAAFQKLSDSTTKMLEEFSKRIEMLEAARKEDHDKILTAIASLAESTAKTMKSSKKVIRDSNGFITGLENA